MTKFKIFTSVTHDLCTKCKQDTYGKRCLWVEMQDGAQKIYMADCWFTKKSNQEELKTQANSNTNSHVKDIKEQGEEASASFSIDDNLDQAVARVKRLLATNPELVEVSQNLLSELCHENFALYMAGKIQRAKSKNIKEVKEGKKW